ncbi:MAG: MipA/OmpV family protein [Granulosicoccus sp.]|nr:MipA/OmpV family protein [Granulosicoccus sp.]
MAQQRPAKGDKSNTWTASYGAILAWNPSYPGDDERRVSLFPAISYEYGENFFFSARQGIGYRRSTTNRLTVGFAVRPQFGRKEDGDSNFALSGDDSRDLIGLGDIDIVPALRVFARYRIGAFTLLADVDRAIGEHDGVNLEIGARFGTRFMGFGPPLILSIGPQVTYSDANYTQAYFGIDAGQSELSGLPVYDAGGGVNRAGLAATAILPISQGWTSTLIVNLSRQQGDAADSPIVTERGDGFQPFVGLGFSYSFSGQIK